MHKVAIIGLDGATFDLIEPWIGEGKLPNLARLMAEGTWGRLDVQLPPNTVPNWPSFMTGTNPGKHGIVWWLRQRNNWQNFDLVNSKTIPYPTIWDLAGRAGKQSIVLNVPATYPPKPIEGAMVTDGILTPPGAEDYTYPPFLRGNLEKAIGGYKLWPTKGFSTAHPEHYLQDIHDVLETRHKALTYLLDTFRWQFLSVVFSATDLVGHAYWRYMDPNHPLYDEAKAAEFSTAIQGVYEHADRILGDVLEKLGPETNVIVMSDHGFGPLYGLSHLNNWLIENDYITFKSKPLTQAKLLLHRMGATIENAYKVAVRLGLLGLKQRVDPTMHGRSLVKLFFLSFDDIDWERTKAVAFGGMGQIFITGEERDSLRTEIMQKLKAITLPGSNQPYVQDVFRAEDIYKGPALPILPDLIVVPTTMKYLDAGVEFYTNKVFSAPPAALTGTHRTDGIFIAHGPDFRKGKQLGGLSILDLAPTAVHMLGLPVPSHMDGRVISDAITESFLATYPIRVVESYDELGQDETGSSYSEEESRLVEQRLKDLGYLS